MRKSFFLCCAVGLLAALSPAVLCAQFQAPNPDELKMTSDPKAPGAAAVYLNIEEIANDRQHDRSFYARIKVLTEKGKELATVEVPYEKGISKVTHIEGRTIEPDGTIVPLSAKPDDLLNEATGGKQFGRMVFTLPAVEPGSILEYKYSLDYQADEFAPPQWEIQRPYFVHKAHYNFVPAGETLVDTRGRLYGNLLWSGRVPPGVEVKQGINTTYTVDVTDVPPVPDEEWMPPISSLLYKVSFYYAAQNNAGQFWLETIEDWSKKVDEFAEPSKPIKTAVETIVSPDDSDLEKARKLYNVVQALDNASFSREKSTSEMKELNIKQPKHAQDTWAERSGSKEDITMLYLAMLRAAGLKAHAIRVVDRDRGIFDPAYMSIDQLDSTLVILVLGDKTTLLDPGEKMCPFGTVSWRHSFAAGIGQETKGVSYVSTPQQQYADNVTLRTGDVTIDAQGNISGYMTIAMTGQEALRWRQAKLQYYDAEVKRRFDTELEKIVPEGVEAHADHFLSMDDPYTNLIAVVKIKGTLGVATGRRLLLPEFFFETRSHAPFVNEEKRFEPVDMHYAERVTDEITYHLPPGLAVEGSPKDANVSWAGHAILVAKTAMQPGQIIVGDTLTRAFTVVKPGEYQDLRGFYQKVAAADQGQLALTAATKNGN
jgi:hypothetical protein